MDTFLIFSGTIICSALFGLSLGLECITCEWTAGNVNDTTGCVSTPHKENAEQCPQPQGNMKYVCEMVLTYTTVKEDHYLSHLSRQCQTEHGNCNNHCNPESGDDCISCCNANNKCNSLPMSSVMLPSHLAFNVTSMATPKVVVPGRSVFGCLLIVDVVLFLL